MKLLTHRDKIREATNVFSRLHALDPETATVEEVRLIIGDTSWTRLTCDECGSDVDAVVICGKHPDAESEPSCICKSCAAEIMGLFK